jgi:hypothetical protein
MVLFWVACIVGEDLPVEALLVGPGLMVLGVILIERRKRRSPGTGIKALPFRKLRK